MVNIMKREINANRHNLLVFGGGHNERQIESPQTRR